MEAIEQVIYKQPNDWNPINPHPASLSRDLLDSVKNALRFEAKGRFAEDRVNLIVENTGLYVAIETAADLFHNVDAVIYCDLGDPSPFVTLDYTTKKDAPEEANGGFVITEGHFSEIANNGMRRLDNTASAIAKRLLDQIECRVGLYSPRSLRLVS
jgi:hypothetical protein